MTLYLIIIAVLLAAILWAHGYCRRSEQPSPTSAINTPLPAISVDMEMDALIDDLNAETERWLWKALAKGPGYRVWRSDPIFEGDQVKHAFTILAPGEDAPGKGTILSWT